MTTKTLTKHLLTCYACQEDFFILVSADSEAEPSSCPFCGSSEIGAYGSTPPVAAEDDAE